MMAGKERVCQMHQQPLKLFCKEDEALICLDCDRSKEHRDHETLPLETASQEYKDQFCNHLKILKEERERIVGCKADLMEESQDLLVTDVTLDPDTAHPRLILSADGKSVRQGEEAQAVPNNPERFNSYYAVLGREGFTGGRHFWEVLVGSEGGWWVGVARKSVKRKGWLNFSPEEGIWALEKYEGNYLAAKEGFNLPLTLSGEPKRIRVCLNYDGGQVAFFDADRAALMYKYSGASFSGETLLPYFYVYKKGHLRLC
uniref:Uncharacterized protein n=1 Tax=Sphaerodactylus townsendi TaxID=933632 RepID=A0ACB8EG64_9SAUR